MPQTTNAVEKLLLRESGCVSVKAATDAGMMGQQDAQEQLFYSGSRTMFRATIFYASLMPF